jgi:hypothetical protein
VHTSAVVRLGVALAVALPAFLLTNPAFQPMAERVAGTGSRVSHRFELARPESLFLDYEIVVASSGGPRPEVAVLVNGTPAARLVVDVLSRQQFGKVRLPADATRAGANEMAVEVTGGAAPTVELSARLNNYYGIAPDIPRAAIVSDEAARLWWASRSVMAHAGSFLLAFVASLGVVWGLWRVGGAARSLAVTLAPAALLVPVLTWAFATDLHVWLFPETVLALALVPWVLVLAGRGLLRRRVLVLKLAGVTLATLLLLEVALRITNAVSPSFIFYADSFGRYRGRPGAPHYGTVLNSRGFNDVERSLERPADVSTRIVALGDSFAFGVVPHAANYLTLLERELSVAAPAEVINMGVSATEPRDYRAILVDEGLAYRPDLVLVSLYLGNDLEARRPRWYEHSYVTTLINFVSHLGRARQMVVRGGGTGAAYDDASPSLDEAAFLRIQMERAMLYTSTDAEIGVNVDRAVRALADIRDLARGAGADCLVVVIPDETQVDAALQAEVARAWDRPLDSIDFARPTRLVAAALARAGVAAVDLLPAFQAAAKGERLYKPRDTHWNLAGNRLAASEIAPAVRARIASRTGAPSSR